MHKAVKTTILKVMGEVQNIVTSITLVSPGLSRFSNTASCLSARTSIRLCLRFTCRSRFFTMSHNESAYFLIPKSTGSDVLYITLAFALFPVLDRNSHVNIFISFVKPYLIVSKCTTLSFQKLKDLSEKCI